MKEALDAEFQHFQQKLQQKDTEINELTVENEQMKIALEQMRIINVNKERPKAVEGRK